MGSGHGGTAESSSATTGAQAENVDTRSVDVKEVAVVGERGDTVVDVSGTDSAGGGSGGRGDSVDVLGATERVTVAGSDSKEETSADDASGSVVQGLGETTTERHVDNETAGAGAGAGAGVGNDEVHTGDNAGAVAD